MAPAEGPGAGCSLDRGKVSVWTLGGEDPLEGGVFRCNAYVGVCIETWEHNGGYQVTINDKHM